MFDFIKTKLWSVYAENQLIINAILLILVGFIALWVRSIYDYGVKGYTFTESVVLVDPLTNTFMVLGFTALFLYLFLLKRYRSRLVPSRDTFIQNEIIERAGIIMNELTGKEKPIRVMYGEIIKSHKFPTGEIADGRKIIYYSRTANADPDTGKVFVAKKGVAGIAYVNGRVHADNAKKEDRAEMTFGLEEPVPEHLQGIIAACQRSSVLHKFRPTIMHKIMPIQYGSYPGRSRPLFQDSVSVL